MLVLYPTPTAGPVSTPQALSAYDRGLSYPLRLGLIYNLSVGAARCIAPLLPETIRAVLVDRLDRLSGNAEETTI